MRRDYTHQFAGPFPTIQRGAEFGHVVSVRHSCSDERVDRAHGKEGHFQKSSRCEKQGSLVNVLVPNKIGGRRQILNLALTFLTKSIMRKIFHIVSQ